MRHLFFSLSAACILLFLFSAVADCQVSPSVSVSKDSLEGELDTLVPQLLKKENVPSVSLAVIRNGKVLLVKAYGLADKLINTPASIATIFQIGSVSKTLTAFAVLRLAEQKMINLDDPIGKYLKRWQLPASKYDNNGVTIRRVLSHTAGLSISGYHGVFVPGDKLPSLPESLNGYSGSDGALQVIHEPGSIFQYSSGGYTLLQLLIEDVTNTSFEKYMLENVFYQLGMKNTVYSWSKELEQSVATPYDDKGDRWLHYQFAESGSGGVYTTATDLARFLIILCDGGKSDDFKKYSSQMITPSPGTGNNYGLGCKIFPINETQKVITHDGANEGWRAAYYIHPPKETA